MSEVFPTPTLGGLQFWGDLVWRDEWRIQQKVNSEYCRVTDPQNVCRATGSFAECLEYLDQSVSPRQHSHLVVLLHGLGRTRRSMQPIADHIASTTGFSAATINYPSTRAPIAAHVEQIRRLLAHVEAESVSFVTHSLGGIIARYIVDQRTPHSFRKLAMLAPPNQGSSLARVLSDTRVVGTLLRGVMGRPALQLALGTESVPDPKIPFIVFAGSQRGGQGINPLIEGDDDGVVSVAETQHVGALEHIVVESIHSTIMNHPRVMRRVTEFLSENTSS